MNPHRVSNILRRIATAIDNSKNPKRHLVAQDLRRVIMAIDEMVINIDEILAALNDIESSADRISYYPDDDLEDGANEFILNWSKKNDNLINKASNGQIQIKLRYDREPTSWTIFADILLNGKQIGSINCISGGIGEIDYNFRKILNENGLQYNTADTDTYENYAQS